MTPDCDVAIVGAGPTGLTLANLLGRAGLRVRVLERQAAPYDLPRAVHFDGEAMRIFQSAGLADQMSRATLVGRGMVFRDARGRVLVDWSRDADVGPQGWHESYRCHQPDVDRILADGLARFAGVELRFGAEVCGLSQTDTLVSLQLAQGDVVSACYVVGCDGANSTIAGLIGTEWQDFGFDQDWLVADLILTQPRPDLGDHSVQFCDDEAPATYVRSVGDRRRWEFRLSPGEGDRETEAGKVWARLARWITPAEAQLERAAIYTFRARMAQTWQQGRVFLAGDAAHQMPPFMGQGMCAGLRDAANLGWKLAQAIKGGEDVLATYATERQPHVQEFIETSVRLGKLISQIAQDGVARGKMASIWPALGPGIGTRESVCGTLAPQPVISGRHADDLAREDGRDGFYVLSRAPLQHNLPVIVGAQDWLTQHGLNAVIVRPDGYVQEALSVE